MPNLANRNSDDSSVAIRNRIEADLERRVSLKAQRKVSLELQVRRRSSKLPNRPSEGPRAAWPPATNAARWRRRAVRGVPRDAGTLRKHGPFSITQISLAPWGVNHSRARSCSWNSVIRKPPGGFDAAQTLRVRASPEAGRTALFLGGEVPHPAPPTTCEFLRIGCRLTMRFCRRSAGLLTFPASTCRCVDPRSAAPELAVSRKSRTARAISGRFRRSSCTSGAGRAARHELEEPVRRLTETPARSARSSRRLRAARSERAPETPPSSSSRPRRPPS